MRVLDVILFAAYTLASTAAVMLIKQFVGPAMQAWKVAPGLSAPLALLAVGAALYGCSFLLWMFILSRTELSIAYPVLIGATLATTTLGAWLLLREPVSVMRLAGIAVVFAGIVLVTRS
jgi:multidrug transporter EmrE-like cation transporter